MEEGSNPSTSTKTNKLYIIMAKYNGWTNYATWRINLEILEDIEFEKQVSADYLKEIVENIIFTNKSEGGYIEDYARAFVSEVNFYEIAKNINEEK